MTSMNMSGYSALGAYSESMVRWQGAGYSLGTTAAAAIQSLPPELDIASSIAVTPFKPLHHLSGVSDVILLAEFSEIEGPMPLVTIPAKKNHGIDLNDFVVKVMSTDYQNTSGEFRVCSDTQLVQQNIEAGVHAYVHYFTLYDVRARGFVRPMCLAYISRDARKLLTYFSTFRDHFCSITNYLKWSNLSWFSSELHNLITDLEYTKDRYIEHMRDVPHDLTLSTVLGKSKRYSFHGQTSNAEFGNLSLGTRTYPPSSPSPTLQFSPTTALSLSSQLGQFLMFGRRSEGSESRDEEECQRKEEEERLQKAEEESMLKHTTLEAVAAQLLDCQHIIHTIQPYLDQPDIQENIENFMRKVGEAPDSPLLRCLEELHLLTSEADSVHKPSIFVMSLMKRNFKDMRGITVLCGASYVIALIKLQEVYEHFSKPYLTLQFEDLDKEVYDCANGSLFIGTIPVINIDSSSQSKNIVSEGPSQGFTDALWDSELIQLLVPNRADTPSPDSEYDDANEEMIDDAIGVPPADDCLEVFHPVASLLDSSGALSKIEDESHERSDENKAEDQSGRSSKGGVSSRVSNSSSRVSSARVSTSSDNVSLGVLNLDDFEDIEEEEGVDVSLISTLDQQIYKTSIDMRMMSSKMCRLSGLIQQFCGVSHCLVHAVLSGRPVLIAAAEPYRALVTVYTKALAALLPHAPGSIIPVLGWHAGTVTSFHTERYSIIGVCIPERLHVQDLMSNATLNQVTVLNIETGHISGVAYSGTLVRGVERYSRRCFKSDSALFAALQANLVAMGLKVFLLYHLLQTTSRRPSEVLKAIGVSRGDWDVIKHLTALVLRQMNAPQATISLCES